jgi:hypothetical protein
MGRVLMNEPPDCPDGHWCPACLMIAKQEQWVMYQDEIQEGYEASGEKLTVIQFPAALGVELRPGRYRAVCGEFPQLGIVDGLCWQHVAGGRAPQPVQPQAPGIIPATGPIPRRRRT